MSRRVRRGSSVAETNARRPVEAAAGVGSTPVDDKTTPAAIGAIDSRIAITEEYATGRVALCDLIAEHGLDPNRYDVEEVQRDRTTLGKVGPGNPGAA